MKRVLHDLWRVAAPLVIGSILMIYSADVARYFDKPSLAPWGLFAGLMLYGAALTHLMRRFFMPYIELKPLAQRAQEHPIGAGLVFLAMTILIAAYFMVASSVVRAAELPENAKRYVPILAQEQRAWWPTMPQPSALGAQIEQETCVSLKSPRCWSPRAELRTSRERGVGLGQITRTARFDALAEIRAAYPDALAQWDWNRDSLYDPRFQLRALVLKDYQGWRHVIGAATAQDRLAFAFAGYNGGIGGVLSDRQLCRGTRDCDASRWFGNVERTSLKAKSAAAGYGKSFFEINREYVHNVLIARRPRYAMLDK